MTPGEDGSVYLHIETHESQLFNGIHMNSIAEWISVRKKNVDGICFVVWSATVVDKCYKLYLPFDQQEDSYGSLETIKLNVALAVADLTNQMRNHMSIH